MKRISGGVNLTVFSTLVAGLAGGCSYEDESTGHEPGAGGAGQIEADSGVAEAGASAAGGGAAGSAGASEAGGLAGSLGEFCAGSGTVVATGDGLPKCTGQVASSVFKFALCSCEDVTFSGFEFTTDGFDSTNPKDPTKNGAAVGANNNYVVNANSKVGGSLLVAGAGQMGMNGSHVVSGDLKTNADELLPLGSVEVERGAWVAGDILGSGLNIKRDLYQPAGKQSIGATVGKSKVVAPVQILPVQLPAKARHSRTGGVV